jgi:hypothetical protein
LTSKTTLSIFAIIAVLTLATAVLATTIITANSAFAAGGPKAEKKNGQKHNRTPFLLPFP